MAADRAFRCVAHGAADRRDLLRRRRRAPWVGRATAARDGAAQDPAGRRAPDLLSRGHRGKLLRRASIGEEPITVEAGEVVVFTNGDPHVMSSAPACAPSRSTADAFDAIAASPLPFFVNYGGGGTDRRPSWYAASSPAMRSPFNPLLDNLPPVIKAGDPRAAASRTGSASSSAWRMIEVGQQARRRRERAGQAERADVHRGGAPPSRDPAAGADRLARRPARSVRRQGVVADACAARRATGRSRSWRARSALSRSVLAERFADLGRHAADALSRQMAHADRRRAC